MLNNKSDRSDQSNSLDEKPNTPRRPFLIARYDNRAVAIRRNTDFAATLASVRKAFPALEPLEPPQIRLSMRLDECEDLPVEISEEIWPEVMPDLTFVDVSTGGPGEQDLPEVQEQIQCLTIGDVTKSEHLGTQANVKPEPIVVRIKDEHANTRELVIPLFSTSTVQQLKELIVKHDNRLPEHLILSFNKHSSLGNDKQLHEYGIINDSTVSLCTQFEVFLNGPENSRAKVSIISFAPVSVLQILAYARLELPFPQVVMCAGEILVDDRKLGSYPQLVPGCDIFVNRMATQPATLEINPIWLRIHPSGSRDNDEGTLRCTVLPKSTVEDLKLLIFNEINLPPSQQSLHDWFNRPVYDHYIIGNNYKSSDNLYL